MMIFVIFDPRKYTKTEIIKELKDEKYTHSFFLSSNQDLEVKTKCLELCNEVWCFGDCTKKLEYKMAEQRRKDIWMMG